MSQSGEAFANEAVANNNIWENMNLNEKINYVAQLDPLTVNKLAQHKLVKQFINREKKNGNALVSVNEDPDSSMCLIGQCRNKRVKNSAFVRHLKFSHNISEVSAFLSQNLYEWQVFHAMLCKKDRS